MHGSRGRCVYVVGGQTRSSVDLQQTPGNAQLHDAVKGSLTVRGGGGRHAYLKETIMFICIKVYINKCVIHIRILSKE